MKEGRAVGEGEGNSGEDERKQEEGTELKGNASCCSCGHHSAMQVALYTTTC